MVPSVTVFLVVGGMVDYGEEMVAGAGIGNRSMDTCSNRETADRTILGDLLVKDFGGVKVKVDPFCEWVRGGIYRTVMALLAQENK